MGPGGSVWPALGSSRGGREEPPAAPGASDAGRLSGAGEAGTSGCRPALPCPPLLGEQQVAGVLSLGVDEVL